MYQSTKAFNNLIQQDSRTFQCLITCDNVTIENIKSVKFTGGSEVEDDFSIGSTVSQYVTIVMSCAGTIEGREFHMQMGLEVDDLTEWIPIGYFTAGKIQKNEEQIEFTAYDRMIYTERTFSMNGTTTDTIAVLKKIEEISKIPVETSGLSSISMLVPKGYSCREVLSYVAQMYGGFAVCNRQGRIEIRNYEDNTYMVGTGRYWDNFEHNDYLFTVDKLTCYTGQDKDGNSSSISSGSGARTISFSNPFMSQSVLDSVFQKLKTFSYMPGTLKMLGDPRIDVWDIITVEDLSGESYKVPIMKLEWEYDGGLTYIVEAAGLSEEETNDGYKGPTTKEMERYYAKLVMIDTAMINKLDVDTAKITYATIKNLDVVKENVQEINGELGNFKNLTANKFTAIDAKITNLDVDHEKVGTLEGEYANLKNVLMGNAGVGDLQNIHLTSENAVIDLALIRTAVMQTVSIADLLAGDISTNKFRILSDDGGILIQGATQQWKDKNGVVRMQAGRDASGNFTFSLFDTTGKGVLIDSMGIKQGAISDGLIVNKMVAENAAIAADKLDINSLFKVINDSSQTINSSRIWFNEKNQSLNQVYSKMDMNIAEIQNTATSASETASVASDTAKKALDTLSGISTLDALGASLDNDAHTVHTNTDGSGGDYSDCYTKMHIYMGDADVTDHADKIEVLVSDGVTGTWSKGTRTYYVNGMTSDNGYVDIFAQYGLKRKAIILGEKVLVLGNKVIQVKTGGTWIKKRFSISKAKDGKTGVSYNVQSSSQIIKKQKDGTMIPDNITFSALKNDNGSISSYLGIFEIEESENDGKTYLSKYKSDSAETMKIYAPDSNNINMIRCTLYDITGIQILDTQTVTVVTDAAGLVDDIKAAQDTADKAGESAEQAKEAITITNQKVANIETGLDGVRLNLSETTTDLRGILDKTFLFNVQHHDNGDETSTASASLYKSSKDVTKEYPATWYSWRKKTESGQEFLGYGYQITVNNEDYEFGGTIVGRFTTYKQIALVLNSKALILGKKVICFNAEE